MNELPNIGSKERDQQKAEKTADLPADFQQSNSETIQQILSCKENIKSIEEELKYFSGRKKKIAENRINEYIEKKNAALDDLIEKIMTVAENGTIPSDKEILLIAEAEGGLADSAKEKGAPEKVAATEKKSNFIKFLDENLNLSPYICECVVERLSERAFEKKKREDELGNSRSSVEALDQRQIDQVRKKIGNLEERESKHDSFDPEEEVQKIRREILATEMLSPRDKQGKFSELKERIAAQKIGIAEINLYLEEKVTNNNRIDLDALKSFFEEKSAKYKLAPFQIERYNLLFDEAEKRIAIVDYYEKRFENLSGKDTFKALFGFEPAGEVEIERRGLCFCVYCSFVPDYANVYAGRAQGEMKERFKKTADGTGGCAMVYTVLPELQEAIVAVKGSREDDFHDQTAIHEEKHILNNFAETVQKLDKRWYLRTEVSYEQATDDKRIQIFFGAKLNYCRERAKDEVLAYLKTGEHPTDILSRLEKSEGEGGLYDYFQNETIYPLFDDLRKIHSEDKLALQHNKSLGKYRSDLKAATKCLLELEDYGFSPDLTISIFQTENLENWPKVLERLNQTAEFRNILKLNMENNLVAIGEEISNLENQIKLIKGSGIFARVRELFSNYDNTTASAIQGVEQRLAVLRNKQESLSKSLESETKK